MEADSGFLPFSFTLGNTKSLSFAYFVRSRHAEEEASQERVHGNRSFRCLGLRFLEPSPPGMTGELTDPNFLQQGAAGDAQESRCGVGIDKRFELGTCVRRGNGMAG